MPLLTDHFCNPEQINFEYYSSPFQSIVDRKTEFRMGKAIWLWPRTEVLEAAMKLKDMNGKLEGDDYSNKFRSYE